MLKQQIQADIKEALKSGNENVVVVLRLVISSINSKEKEKRYKVLSTEPNLKETDLASKTELTEDELISVLSSEVKKRNDAIALYEKGKRPELAEKEQKEIEILKKYLPEQLSTEELKKLVEESISRVGAKEIKDTGKIMADLMPKVKGKADGGAISKIIKDILK